MLKVIKLSLAISVVMFFNSCRKDCPCNDPYNPVCPNYDSCLTKKTVTADFKFGYEFREDFKDFINGQPYITDDTIYQCGGVDSLGNTYGIKLTFVPVEKNAKYTWKLGSEIITDRTFSRLFENAKGPQRIPVTLIVEKEPNRNCFPNDDGRDTVTKYIDLRYQWNFPIMGKYKVLFEGEKDSSFIEVRPWEAKYNCSKCKVVFSNLKHPLSVTLINFKNTQDTIRTPFTTWFIIGNKLIFEDVREGGEWGEIYNNEMKLNSDGTVEASYSTMKEQFGPNFEHRKISFKGRKIQ